MADTLFISRDDLLRYTSIGGNVDTDKIIPHIKIAQDTQILPILGTKLYNKIEDIVEAGTSSGVYYDLLIDFIQPCTIHYATAEFLTFHAYDISNGGIFRHNGDQASTPSLEEVQHLVQKARDNGDNYRARLVDHFGYYPNRYPELNENQQDGVYPDYKRRTTRWVI